ncbi:hypothetical protein DERP_011720 [Dermatophagoides pteronyssinus]|uniref:Uncharacterized protein n=1 Tax=Dermatophagoides pteronyssinus TaxID=6956 RepID=A0ABQ8J334_DERPT|nr:hypothetical protein DERP_011720 [Dermatophagoides pteronyssinus]
MIMIMDDNNQTNKQTTIFRSFIRSCFPRKIQQECYDNFNSCLSLSLSTITITLKEKYNNYNKIAFITS